MMEPEGQAVKRSLEDRDLEDSREEHGNEVHEIDVRVSHTRSGRS